MYQPIKTPEDRDIIYLEITSDLEVTSSHAKRMTIPKGSVTWVADIYKTDIRKNNSVHIEGNRHYENFRGTSFVIISKDEYERRLSSSKVLEPLSIENYAIY